jgi:arylsulfatase A-like enzyme
MNESLRPQAQLRHTIAESTAAFPHRRTSPPPGAPNVVVIVLDDLGFGQLGCFGSDIATPNIDALAAEGLRYNRFHVTAMCSPTRAAMLTGRNHHAVGMGFVTDLTIGFPGYNGRIPKSAATLPRILRDNGWSTYAVGKWHLIPRWEQSAAGPFDFWPLGQGFERYYGFLAGDTNQYAPDLVCDNGFVDPPATPEDGYHLTEDLADRAIRLIQDQRHASPDRPFFLYFATGAMHAPHQAPRSYIDAYAGQFDGGWERWREARFARQVELGIVPEGTTLSERPPWVPDWDALPDDERKLFARFMEVFAGFLTHTDEQIGRVLDHLRAVDALDDTLVLLISDNGTSAEGGPHGSLNEHRFTHDKVDDIADTIARIDDLGGHRSYNHYPWGWAWAGNTPLKLWKRYTWLGGVRTPLVVRWPGGIAPEAAGGVRSQFAHAVDLFTTVLDACGLAAPARVDGHDQLPVEGASLRPTFDDADAPSPRDTQYFELLGSRAIYHDGWKATTDHVGAQLSVETDALMTPDFGSRDYATDRWHLYRLTDDFAEAHDVADEHPDVVRKLEQLWWAEAGRNGVLPLEDALTARAVAMDPNPNLPRHRSHFRPGAGGINEDSLPPMGAGFRLHASVEAPATGVLCALGDWNNGWGFYLLEGSVPVGTINLFGEPTSVRGPALDGGRHDLELRYDRKGGGHHLSLHVDGAEVDRTDLPGDLPFRWQIGGAGLLVGRDVGFPVCDDYQPPFPLTVPFDGVVLEIPMFAPRPSLQDEVRLATKHE